ncbi:hypothetical protein DXG03_005217 [Asterophora parasitica]|uniref:Uncharacterized protein n=1 Tax=Asterophora parasitica TaxID=117018 RepID=A0A9P7K8S3_9AGAR|nr:hypothetical protein DXG03_005217 [Asterophora parasitica]
MQMNQRYYQIGGFQPHIEWPREYRYDDKKVAQLIAGDASALKPRDSKQPVELVLGIKRTGTSHLLLTEIQLDQIERAARLRLPNTSPAVTSNDFESLSPIYFHDPDQFAAKFSTLKIKTVKNRSPTDNSQTNKQFISGDAGVQRGGFEHGRLFYRTLHNLVDHRTYGLNDASWARSRSFNVCSFVFTPRLPDTRSTEDRRKSPIALDCGFAEATMPELKNFEYGTTEKLDGSIIHARVRELFSDERLSREKPTILLVHDEELTKNMLQNCGVNVSLWESGLEGFLGLHRRGAHRDRERSRSPPRSYYHAGPSSRSRHFSRRPSPGPTSGEYRRRTQSYSANAPVYVVDIKVQFMTLMQTATSSESVTKIAKYLGLTQAECQAEGETEEGHTEGQAEGQAEGWCAGNEAVASRREPPIPIHHPSAAAQVPPVEYDSDQDPNDLPPPTAPQTQIYEPASDSDYGESSDDDD